MGDGGERKNFSSTLSHYKSIKMYKSDLFNAKMCNINQRRIIKKKKKWKNL